MEETGNRCVVGPPLAAHLVVEALVEHLLSQTLPRSKPTGAVLIMGEESSR